MSIKKARLAQGETTNNGGKSTGSCRESDWDDFLYWEYLPDPGDNLTEEEYSVYKAEAEAFRLTPAGAATMAEIEAALKLPPSGSLIELTIMKTSRGVLSKHISLKDGKVLPDGSACKMTIGQARRCRLSSMAELAGLINSLESTEALALGRLIAGIGDDLPIATKARRTVPNGWEAQIATTITRSAEFFHYEPGKPALLLIDIDVKGMPDDVRVRVETEGGFWEALCLVLPGLSTTARVTRASTSSGLSRTDTGEQFPGSQGQHIYLHVADGADAERCLRDLHDRCWLYGFGWNVLSSSGAQLSRSLVDRMVAGPERLVFEGAPIIAPPLHQDTTARMAVAREGVVLDTLLACPPLAPAEAVVCRRAKDTAAAALKDESVVVRKRYVAERAQELAERTAMPLEAARRVIEKQTEGVLYPDIVLPFDDADLDGATVADVLADPKRFEGETLADPIEGIDYGHGKAKIMLRTDGTPWIHSFAHGRTVYELRHDAISARAALDAAAATDKATVVNAFVAASLNGDFDPIEKEELHAHAAELSGASKKALGAKLARAQVDDRAAAPKSELEAFIADFNMKFMVVNESGKVLVYRPSFNPGLGREEYERIMISDFYEMHRPDSVNVGSEKYPTYKPAAETWLDSPKRREFMGGVVFDPQEKHQDDQLNLWRGFAVEPVEGDWSLLRDHVFNVVCAGKDEEFRYLMGWEATMFQFPWLHAEVAIVMRGREGTGKGILARALYRLMGQHALHISDPKHLVGSFNRHLLDTVFLFADEAFFAGDRAHIGALKRLITEPTLSIEGKYMNLVEAKNRLHIMMASNDEWVVPASQDARRYAIFDVLDTHMGDRAYFKAIQEQLDNGGYAAMLYDLLHYDLTGFEIRNVPQTSGLAEQKKLSLAPEETWWMSVLHRGYVHLSKHSFALSPDFQGQWVDRVSTNMLYESYLEHFKRGRNYHPITIEGLGRFIVRMGGQGRKYRNLQISETFDGVKMPARTPGYLIGTLDQAREAFRAAVKFEMDWQDAPEETEKEQKDRGGEPPKPPKKPKF
jgi:hypothetical protein